MNGKLRLFVLCTFIALSSSTMTRSNIFVDESFGVLDASGAGKGKGRGVPKGKVAPTSAQVLKTSIPTAQPKMSEEGKAAPKKHPKPTSG